jgi:hypothetical protein
MMEIFSFLNLLRERRSGLLPMLIAQKSLNETLVNGEKFLLILVENNSYLRYIASYANSKELI